MGRIIKRLIISKRFLRYINGKSFIFPASKNNILKIHSKFKESDFPYFININNNKYTICKYNKTLAFFVKKNIWTVWCAYLPLKNMFIEFDQKSDNIYVETSFGLLSNIEEDLKNDFDNLYEKIFDVLRTYEV